MSTFPRIIHQIWLQGSDLVPEKYHVNIEKIQSLNPKFTHIIWDQYSIQEQMARDPDQRYLSVFKRVPHLHTKVDLARYYLLYKYGGISIDMDATCERSLEELDSYIDAGIELVISEMRLDAIGTFMATSSFAKMVNNATLLVTQPSSPVIRSFLDFCIDLCIKRKWSTSKNGKTFDILETTSPKILRRWIDRGEFSNQIQLMPAEVFEPCLGQKCDMSHHTFISHKHDRSWVGEKESGWIKLYLEKPGLFISLIVLILISILFCISKI